MVIANLNQAPTLDKHITVVETMAAMNISPKLDVHMAMVAMTKAHLLDRTSRVINMRILHHTNKVMRLDSVDHRGHRALNHGVSSRPCRPMVSHHLVKDTLAKATAIRINTIKADTATAKDHDTNVTAITTSHDKMNGRYAYLIGREMVD